MTTVFIICAALGSGILVIQLILLLLGFGFDTDAGGGADGGLGGYDAGADGDLDLSQENDSSWFFSVLSVRSVVAALAFFGLAGLAMVAGDAPALMTFAVACGAGAVAMVIVAWLMRLLYSLNAEGNIRIAQAVGLPGSVYLNVPGERGGSGKVTVEIQGRSMEFLAMTNGAPLPTGSPITVVGIIGPDTVEVAPVHEGKGRV